MKITAVECFPVYNGSRNNLFVTVDTDEGIWGVGESGLSNRELAVIGAIEHFKPQLIGQDAGRIEHLWQTLFRGGFFPANRVLCSAISAIDIALWDILGKRAGRADLSAPGRARARQGGVLPAYPGAGRGDNVQALVDNARQHVDEGWKFVRWGLPQDGDLLEPREAVKTALKQLEAVRTAVGDDIELCLDIHTRLELTDAVRLCRASEQFRPFFMEDALRSENPHRYQRLGSRPRCRSRPGSSSRASGSSARSSRKT